MYEQGKPLKFAGIWRRSSDLQQGLTPAIPLEISLGTEVPGNTRVIYFSGMKPPDNPIISCSGHFLSKRNKQWWERVWIFGVIDNKRETQDLRPGTSDFKAHERNRTPHAFTCFDFFFSVDPLWESIYMASVVVMLNLQVLGWPRA